jgi:hypothetical protein
MRSAGRAPGQCELRRGQDVPSFPRAPMLARGGFPSLRSGQVSLDEAKHFLHNRDASVAALRWCAGSSRNAVRNHPGFSVRLRRNLELRVVCLASQWKNPKASHLRAPQHPAGRIAQVR